MSDNPFASPNERRRDAEDAPQGTPASAATPPASAASAPSAADPQQQDTEVIDPSQVRAPQAPVSGAAYAQPPATVQQPVYAQPPAPHGAMAAQPDGTFSTAEPAYDGAGYHGGAPAPHQAPTKKDKRGRVGAGAVAGITAGALVLGLGGGVLGAWAFDEFTEAPQASIATSTVEAVDRPEGSVAAVAAEAMPSAVSIEASSQLGSSTGSGFVIREDGYILTNNHVVEGAQDITVVFSDGSEHPAELIGATGDYDLAVLHVELSGLTPLVFADSDQVVVGDETIAVGSPLGLEATVTTGIVSSLHRPVRAGESSEPAFIDAIQTDAAINPGNSGGPLLNANGEVIGVNSAIATLSTSTDTTGSIGLGFAITSNQAKRTAEELIETGTATYPIIGVLLDDTYTGEGVKVLDDPSGVTDGMPAGEAGIEPGDVITAIDGRPITQVDELIVSIRAMAPGDEVTLTVLRDNQEQDITVTLASSATLEAQQG
ncbi:S1C family serine protease [Demequina globuliformis]|uniref:S1C family serine protease n=1 Tax=Demequina globuliformis TaxID=676202 RepID=UPI000782D6E4|nr:trypsin-like peptidase domain-containing protein [Demequina globuliformis]